MVKQTTAHVTDNYTGITHQSPVEECLLHRRTNLYYYMSNHKLMLLLNFFFFKIVYTYST